MHDLEKRNESIPYLVQVDGRGEFERAGAGNDAIVVQHVGDRAQTVAARLLDLRDRVLVRSLDEHRARERVAHALNEGVHLLAERVLVHQVGVTEARRVEVVHRVDGDAAARQRQTLEVALLGAANADHAVLDEGVERDRVNALLVDDHKARVGVGADAHLLLELDDLVDLGGERKKKERGNE